MSDTNKLLLDAFCCGICYLIGWYVCYCTIHKYRIKQLEDKIEELRSKK